MQDHESGYRPSFFTSQGEIIGSVFHNHRHPEPVFHEKVLYDEKTIKKLP